MRFGKAAGKADGEHYFPTSVLSQLVETASAPQGALGSKERFLEFPSVPYPPVRWGECVRHDVAGFE